MKFQYIHTARFFHKGMTIGRFRGIKGYNSIEEFQGNTFNLIKDPADLKSKEKYPYTIPPECPYVPVVDENTCTLCGECQTSCIYSVFK